MNDDKPKLFRPGIGKNGMNELHYAAYCGDLPTIKTCLDKGMDPNKKDKYRSYTALHWLMDMAATGGPRIEILNELISAGADLKIKTDDNQTAMSLAKKSGSELGDELVKILIENGVKK